MYMPTSGCSAAARPTSERECSHKISSEFSQQTIVPVASLTPRLIAADWPPSGALRQNERRAS